MRLSVPTTVFATALSLSFSLSLAACKNDSPSEGLPPATEWNATPSAASGEGSSGLKPGVASAATDPHAGLGLQTGGATDPHAGLGLDIDTNVGTNGGGIAAESGLSAPSPNRAIDSSKFLRGTITPTPAVAKLIKPEYAVFLSVKRYDPATGLAKPGSPMAVDKLERAALPASFDLGERQAMVSGTAFSGEVLITVHVSQTGDALSKVKGDLIGTVRATIPSEGIKISVDTVVP